jgi:transposase
MFAAVDRGMEPEAVATLFEVSVSWIYKALGRRRANR